MLTPEEIKNLHELVALVPEIKLIGQQIRVEKELQKNKQSLTKEQKIDNIINLLQEVIQQLTQLKENP